MHFLRKRMNTNPKRGPIHFRSPARVLWRTVRGMVPHKTARGNHALERLKVRHWRRRAPGAPRSTARWQGIGSARRRSV